VIALAVDSGPRDGAIAVVRLDGSTCTAVAVAHWRRVQRNREPRALVELWTAGDDVRELLAGPDDGGYTASLLLTGTVQGMRVDASSVEALVPHRDTSRASLIALGESAGAAVQWVRMVTGTVPTRPTASQWRVRVGVPLRPSSECASVARALVGHAGGQRRPVRVHSVPASIAASDHAADALLMAELRAREARSKAGAAGGWDAACMGWRAGHRR